MSCCPCNKSGHFLGRQGPGIETLELGLYMGLRKTPNKSRARQPEMDLDPVSPSFKPHEVCTLAFNYGPNNGK